MKISEIKAGQGKINIEAAVVEIGEAKEINKYNKNLKVATAIIQDDSGQIKLSLWNNEIEKVKVGDKIKITNGYASEFKGEKQLTIGKFGKIEIIGKAEEELVRTNAPVNEIIEEDSIEEDSDEEW